MPKVYLTEVDRLCVRLAKWVYGEMKSLNLSQKILADKMGISRQALGKKLKKAKFTYEDFVFFVNEFEPDTKTLLHIVGL